MNKLPTHFFLSKLRLLTFILCFLLTVVTLAWGGNAGTKAFASVPSPVFLAPCPSCAVTPTVYQGSPSSAAASGAPQISSTQTSPVTSQSPNNGASPSTSPCQTSQLSINSQNSGTQTFSFGGGGSHRRGRHGGGGGYGGNKYHYSGGNGFLQQIMQFLIQLIELILKQLGINLPITSTPCGTTTPSSTPQSGATTSGAPSSGSPTSGSNGGGGGGSGGGSGSATTGPTTQPGTTGTPAGTTTSGFVTQSGQNLMLNGKVFKFIGFDAYGMTGCYSGTAWTTAQLDTYFSSLPAEGVTRLWAMQEYGTSSINTVLTEAAKYNQHVILTLSNDSSTCDTGDGPSGNKADSYYQTGYQSTLIPWINSIVPMFKNNKSVMMWEIMNEPVEETESIMQPFLKATSNAIRADDPNHLIAVGGDDAANFGGNSNFTTDQNLPNINAIGFHDYAWDYEGKVEVSGNFTTAQSTAKSLNKPLYTGEAGVEGGSSCNGSNGLTPANRVTYLTTKANDYFNGGLSGILFWEYEPSQASWVTSCAYEMYPGDPMITAVKNYSIP